MALTFSSDRHNALAREFVLKVVSETNDIAELMVVMESSIFATLLTAEKLYGLSQKDSIDMLKTAMREATRRYIIS
jgi:hypothetical protein